MTTSISVSSQDRSVWNFLKTTGSSQISWRASYSVLWAAFTPNWFSQVARVVWSRKYSTLRKVSSARRMTKLMSTTRPWWESFDLPSRWSMLWSLEKQTRDTRCRKRMTRLPTSSRSCILVNSLGLIRLLRDKDSSMLPLSSISFSLWLSKGAKLESFRLRMPR